MRLPLTRRCGLAGACAAAACLWAAAPPLFEEVVPRASGIAWVHDNGRSDQRHLPETMGPGCAFLDYDSDGWMDLYLVNSGASDFYRPRTPIRNALYRNNHDGTFRDVTERAGVAGGFFGMGAASADYDNDGHADLLVTGYGRAVLYRNRGDGTFEDATARSGLRLSGWTTSAVWFDFDNDGWLDLFVLSFIDFSPPHRRACGDSRLGERYYCVPINAFPPTTGFLFRNRGDGTFRDAGHRTEIDRAFGKGLGVVATDINNDGRLDLFVANDTVQNFLFVNRGGGRWDEIGLVAGVGFGENGQARSGMGVDAADFDGDGWEDLFVANIDHEIFSLYLNQHNETFRDAAAQHDVARSTRLLSGWGLRFFDLDNDGRLDLMLANGHPDDMVEHYRPGVGYREPLLLFRQRNGRLRDISGSAGPVFAKRLAARGMAFGDYNNDGRLDVLVGVNGGAPLLLRNHSGAGNHWLGLDLRGSRANRDAVGARITWSAGGVVRSRLKRAGGSYLSSHDPREVLGLGAARKLEWVEIRWPAPSTHVDRLTGLDVDRYITIVEGGS